MYIRAEAYIVPQNIRNYREEVEATSLLFGKSHHLYTQQAKYSKRKELIFFFLKRQCILSNALRSSETRHNALRILFWGSSWGKG